MAFGLKEAIAKTEELRKMGPNKRKKFIASNPIRIVIDPRGQKHIIDHHHFGYALLQLGFKKVPVKVEADFSNRKMTDAQFLSLMKKRRWIHLYDQMGCGPHNPIYLAPDIRGLADDPYRSLVWAVKNKGAIGKSNEEFYEFEWAQFLRKKNLLKNRTNAEFKRAVIKAAKLCRSKEAKKLPGFVGIT